MIYGRKIDHLVYAVPDLEKAMESFEKTTGVRPLFGGYHPTQGTKNALVRLGDDCYLEILATDQGNTAIAPPRWMGIDLINTPAITRWAIKSSQLQKDKETLQKYHPEMGVIQGGQRNQANGDLLVWELAMPLAQPAIEIIPFMVDWQKSSVHPSAQLPRHCSLIDLTFSHPNPEQIIPTLEELSLNINIRKEVAISISAKIQSPKGIIQI